MSSERLQVRLGLARPPFAMDVDFAIRLEGVTGLFGPSGAGKSTLLKCLAGLERAETARIVFAGETWEDTDGVLRLPAHERATGFVFQEARLFPHLDVRGNLQYGQRRSQRPGPDFDHVVELLELGPLLDRQPATLSGGEAQRVAIGRAVLHAPRLLLMDEPVSALDVERRGEVLPFIEQLHADLGVPILYVSHNIDEICMLSDQLIVMDAGRIVVHGDLQQVLLQTDLPVLGGDEACAVLRAESLDYDEEYDLTRVQVDGGELWIPGRHTSAHAGLRLRIRANDVSLVHERVQGTSILNSLEVNVVGIDDEAGHSVLVHLAAGGSRLLARITRKSRAELDLSLNQQLVAQIKSVSVRRASL